MKKVAAIDEKMKEIDLFHALDGISVGDDRIDRGVTGKDESKSRSVDDEEGNTRVKNYISIPTTSLNFKISMTEVMTRFTKIVKSVTGSGGACSCS